MKTESAGAAPSGTNVPVLETSRDLSSHAVERLILAIRSSRALSYYIRRSLP